MIDSLRQLLGVPGEGVQVCREVRDKLRAQFSAPGYAQVRATNYLDLQEHWEAIVRGLAEVTGHNLSPDTIRVICISPADLLGRQDNGAAVGDGETVVFVVNSGNTHFDPLLPEA